MLDIWVVLDLWWSTKSAVSNFKKLLQEYDQEWKSKIMTSKFEFHNAQWIEMVQSQQFQENDYMYADEPFNPFIHEEDILEHPELYYNPGEDGFIFATVFSWVYLAAVQFWRADSDIVDFVGYDNVMLVTSPLNV